MDTVEIGGCVLPGEIGRRYRELIDSPSWLAFCERHAGAQVALVEAIGQCREIADRLKAEGVSGWNIDTDYDFVNARRLAENWRETVRIYDEYRLKMLMPYMKAALPTQIIKETAPITKEGP